MNELTYIQHKANFQNLTGQNADQNLDAFFSYINMLNMNEIKDLLKDLRIMIKNVEKNTMKQDQDS